MWWWCVGEVEGLGCVCASGGLKVDCNGHVLVTYSQCEYVVGGQEVVHESIILAHNLFILVIRFQQIISGKPRLSPELSGFF